jgi:hypothetical protein
MTEPWGFVLSGGGQYRIMAHRSLEGVRSAREIFHGQVRHLAAPVAPYRWEQSHLLVATSCWPHVTLTPWVAASSRHRLEQPCVTGSSDVLLPKVPRFTSDDAIEERRYVYRVEGRRDNVVAASCLDGRDLAVAFDLLGQGSPSAAVDGTQAHHQGRGMPGHRVCRMWKSRSLPDVEWRQAFDASFGGIPCLFRLVQP